jgi:hypothetical protein
MEGFREPRVALGKPGGDTRGTQPCPEPPKEAGRTKRAGPFARGLDGAVAEEPFSENAVPFVRKPEVKRRARLPVQPAVGLSEILDERVPPEPALRGVRHDVHGRDPGEVAAGAAVARSEGAVETDEAPVRHRDGRNAPIRVPVVLPGPLVGRRFGAECRPEQREERGPVRRSRRPHVGRHGAENTPCP